MASPCKRPPLIFWPVNSKHPRDTVEIQKAVAALDYNVDIYSYSR